MIMGQKKRIGSIYNRPIIDGDINLKTTNEIHKSELYNSKEGESSRESEFYYFDGNKLNYDCAEFFRKHYTLIAYQIGDSNGLLGIRQRVYFDHTFIPGSGFSVINEYFQVPKHIIYQGISLPLFEVLVLENVSDLMEFIENPELMEEGKKELETILTPCMVTEEVFYNGKKPDFNELIELVQGMP